MGAIALESRVVTFGFNESKVIDIFFGKCILKTLLFPKYIPVFLLKQPEILKALFQKYRSVLRFVLLFLGTYFFLSLGYAVYLHITAGGAYPPDPVTHLVAKQSSDMLNALGYEAVVIAHASEPTMKLFVEGKFLARIIEGCNAISIIILFIAFVVAFAESFKKTLLFLFAGSVLIYGVNVLRIVILAVMLYRYPDQKELLHGVVFPGLIYGMVFVLWMLWVRMLNPKIENNA
jgi:exosortase family protein XrtF